MVKTDHVLTRSLTLIALISFAVCLGGTSNALGSSSKLLVTHNAPPGQVVGTGTLTGPDFPTLYGVQQTGHVNATFDAFGSFGTGFLPCPLYITQWPQASFETPPGSDNELLFAGAIWVGGIIHEDTLVSVGADGWQATRELYPPAYTGLNPVGSMNEAVPVGDYALRAVYSDTVHEGITYEDDFPSHRLYRPLGIDIAIRSEIWHGAPSDNCVLYDVVISNIGLDTIHNGYVGLFMDADVGYAADLNRQQDDIAGSIRDSGVAYIADNDGNFADQNPATTAFACRFLWSSWNATDTSFNWWVSNVDPLRDFGPRLRANLRDFGTDGGLGTPEGDANKYYVMSHPEWDYDQVKTGTVGITDSQWVFPAPALAPVLSKGYDTKFLLSLGHFDLLPDSSVRFIFSTYAADSLHVNPTNGLYLTDSAQYDPDAYLSGLNFTSLLRNAGVAEGLAQQLTDPDNPVEGLRVTHSGHDTVIVQWDDWCADNIDGYNIYLAPLGGSSPALVTPVDQVGRVHSYMFTGLQPTHQYVCTVAHRTGSTEGSLGQPLNFTADDNSPTDVTEPQPGLPKSVALNQNYPNPFNPSTTISFDLPKAGHVVLDIFNLVGQKVATLVDRELVAGNHRVEWNSQNDRHQPVASGVYLYRLRAGGFTETKKMILLR